MENKYYIPTTDELGLGYQYESRIYNDSDDTWSEAFSPKEIKNLMWLHDDQCALDEGMLRVKHLDTEDVQLLGWKLEANETDAIGIKMRFSKEEESRDYLQPVTLTHELYYYTYSNIPQVIIEIQDSLENIRLAYHGDCKSINELRKLHQFLNIK